MIDKTTRQKMFDSVEAVTTEAREKGIRLSVALTDLSGYLFFFYRDPKGPLVSIEVSQKKAYTSYAMRLDTKKLHELTSPGKPLFQLETSLDGKIVSFPGGLYTPQLASLGISAIGISGSPDPDDDELFAQKLLTVLTSIVPAN